MNKCIGKIINTHGIKGELKVVFEDESLFVVGDELLIVGNSLNDTFLLKSKRIHKNNLLITFDGIDNINQVLKYKNCEIFIEGANQVFMSDIISYEVYTNKVVGVVREIFSNGKQDILVLDNGSMIPYVDEFISKIDDDKKIIYVNEIEGLINEN